MSHRIDIHHHVIPPDYVAELGRRNIEWTGGVGPPRWSTSYAREVMERFGIAAAVAAIQPQPFWDDADSAVHWARHCNEYLAGVVRDDPAHFGGFASLPLPDTAAACRELEYSYDVLKLDGVCLTTSHGNRYLGDPDFDELLHELNRRSAVVFFHPNTKVPGADVPKLALPYALVEFTFDTTRCVANLLFTGVLERFPNIRFILPHAGGTVPYLALRLQLGDTWPAFKEHVPKGVLHYLKRLYETALSTSGPAFAALAQLVPTSQILFGSDFPFANEPLIQLEVSGLESSKILDDRARQAIDRDNALALFPRFGRTS